MALVMESSSAQEYDVGREKSIHDLPTDILEFILDFISPYDDLKNCSLVSKLWSKLVEDVIRRKKIYFSRSIRDMGLNWQRKIQYAGPTIAERYSHCACRLANSMYVFGGCTVTNTTFNDLWRFDLNTRQWIRPLVCGTYPTPKACSTLVSYGKSLVLFGGWTHPSPNPIYQSARLYNHLHIYDLEKNNWFKIDTLSSPPAMAGHSATISRNSMIVFGGAQSLNWYFRSSSNDVWVLDLSSYAWLKQDTTEPKPTSRFGQTQVQVDDDHILIIGGCGGPNMVLSDIWLLTISKDSSEPWLWQNISVRNSDSAPSLIWCHPGCKVNDKVVFLGKSNRKKSLPSCVMCPIVRVSSRDVITPRDNARNLLDQVEIRKRLQPQNQNNTEASVIVPKVSKNYASSSNLQRETFGDTVKSDTSCSSSACSSQTVNAAPSTTNFASISTRNLLTVTSENLAPSCSGLFAHNTALPSIRPNALKNRQKQMEGFMRMEERIRNMLKSNGTAILKDSGTNETVGSAKSGLGADFSKDIASSVKEPMIMFVLDISNVLTDLEVEWLSVEKQVESANSPEETSFYTLICGRGELIMFGGIKRDSFDNNVMKPGAGIVSNGVHILSYITNVV